MMIKGVICIKIGIKDYGYFLFMVKKFMAICETICDIITDSRLAEWRKRNCYRVYKKQDSHELGLNTVWLLVHQLYRVSCLRHIRPDDIDLRPLDRLAIRQLFTARKMVLRDTLLSCHVQHVCQM